MPVLPIDINGVYLVRRLFFHLLLVSSIPFSSTPAIVCQYLYSPVDMRPLTRIRIRIT